jgi:hypothetical protein
MAILSGVEENQRLKIKEKKYRAKIKNVKTGSQIKELRDLHYATKSWVILGGVNRG